jgi:hypothetical protein
LSSIFRRHGDDSRALSSVNVTWRTEEEESTVAKNILAAIGCVDEYATASMFSSSGMFLQLYP